MIILTFASFASFSQVRIKVKVENHQDSIYYLLKYKSDRSHSIIDTSSISTDYRIFDNKYNYEEGIYIVADSRQNPLFEVLLGKDQTFSIHVEELMDLKSYKVKGCKETATYFDIYYKTTYNNLYIKALESEIEYYPDNKRKIDSIKNKLLEYQESMLSKKEDSFINTYIKFIEKNSFADLPLCDNRILNSRLLKNRLDEYFNHCLSSQTPEFICQRIDELIERTNCSSQTGRSSHEVRDYILWYLYSKYFTPEKIENESVYIHLVDNYFSKLEINNLTENIRNRIIERANILRKITIGQSAPNISYIDEGGDTISLQDIESDYIVLFFYKPECQKCIRDKRILETLMKDRNDIIILQIDISDENSDINHDIIYQYDIMTTPTIYLLDTNKMIVAKHIKAEDIKFQINKR